MEITVKVLLVAAIVVLCYMCYRIIMGPIEFEKERVFRESAIQARLIDIRNAQIEYKIVYGVYAANFGELRTFLKEKKLPFVRKVGELTDEQLVKDTLFSPSYNVDSIGIVPVAGINANFIMDTATVKSVDGYGVKLFEAGVLYDVYLSDLDHQQLNNLKGKMNKMGRYLGLRVGSVTENNNNAGNWE